ncbi:MAG TPA: tetratricopeptide repeat protein [Candidatus Acidoferrales bacterium]|nr:tetratricopeptide repeat protein [Candidatus Acidoferrales bacterium]
MLLLVIASGLTLRLLQPASARIPATASVTERQIQHNPGVSPKAEAELQAGISLTKEGRFAEAIPHFLNARGHVVDEYAANFNLALCYVATGHFEDAIAILKGLETGATVPPVVNNLLTQAYIGAGRYREASNAFEQAVKEAPQDEKLYLFIADACLDSQAYDFGLKALNIGLQNLPRSSRLHYERGVFLSFENEPDAAVADFELASKLAPQTDIAYMAAGQKALLEGNISEAIRVTREGIKRGHRNYILLTIFGDAVARSGEGPGQPEFAEAEAALKQAVAARPNYADSQAILGELYLSEGRLDDAIARLETARKLAPNDPSVYSHLAIAYRRKGKLDAANAALAKLAELNQKQTAKYKNGSSGRRAGYISSGRLPHL